MTFSNIRYFNGGDISASLSLPEINVNEIGIVAYRAKSGNPKISLPTNAGYYDYSLMLSHAYHSSGGLRVSNGISQTNVLGGNQIADLTTNGAYTSIIIIYKRIS